jgi:ATP-binding cassette, subfamily B, bacterial
VIIAGSTALVLGYGAHRMFAGHLSPGELVVFLAYLKNAFKPMKSVAKYTARLAKAAAAGDRVLELLEEEPEVRSGRTRWAPRFSGDLRFEGLTFAYPDGEGCWTHRSAPEAGGARGPGRPSGTGKSTVASLLLRLRDPEQGRILLDGRDIRAFTLASVRGRWPSSSRSPCSLPRRSTRTSPAVARR